MLGWGQGSRVLSHFCLLLVLDKVVIHVHIHWDRDWLIDDGVLLALVLLTLAPKCLLLITFVTQSRILVGMGGSREIKITHLRILF